MTLVRRKFLLLAVAAVATFAIPRLAVAQAYPTRPVTMVVPFGAGGPADTIGRILAEGMRARLGQPVIVENVVGASGTIGVGRVARASPDGHTFVLGNWATHVLNGPMFTLQFDLQKDFQPVSLVSSDPLIVIAKKTLPANDLTEFVAWLKAHPDQATQGTTGAGGAGTVAGLLFQKETGTRFRSVPYRGGQAPATQDLVAGQIDFMISDGRQFSAPRSGGHHQGLCRNVKTPPERSAQYPDRSRGWTPRVLRLELASDISTQVDSKRRSRQAECRCCDVLGRCNSAQTAWGAWTGDFLCRSADA